MDILVCLCSCPDADTAERIAKTLVTERLAACVNRIPGVLSDFRWQGQIQSDAEVLLLIKTSAARFDALSARIIALHPYELPEVIAVKVTHGLERYLSWVETETRPP